MDAYQLLLERNATHTEYPTDKCIHQLFEAQVKCTPDAVAVGSRDEHLTYRELNGKASQLAHHLQKLGVGPEVLVGICMERSLDLVAGLLGILKAGGAYVPLDPTYPPERLAFMLEDAHVPILLTQQHLLTRLPAEGIQTICLDTDAAVLVQQSETDPSSAVTADDLVYVIYTSGSTGRPKGVPITHNNLLNLVFWHQRAFAVTPADRATQVTSPAFDAAGWELWPYLTIGASIYLPDEETRAAPVLLRDWLVSRGITITFLPTPLAESVMALEWPSTTALRFLLTGADTLHHYPPPSLPFALINNYGPTETTVVATFGRVLPTVHPDGPPSIGRPIANTQIYILDEHLQQVPIGTPGELYIGGAGVGSGYLNRPELTADRFIPDPFSQEPGTRLYKTNDLARFLPDGQIAFMGRTDQQIKIRGYRIEPDEIASVLNRHPAVQTSLVVAREDTPDEKRLVAYIVLVRGAQVTANSLRETLAAYLPDYMVPSAFVQLEALPLTANGKVDRPALPTPDATNTIGDRAVTEPNTLIEQKLARIVAPLLGLEEVGVDENFFMLGGHSLLGAQVVVRVSETFGVQLALRKLFEAPSVRQLAAEIESLILAKVEAMSDEEALSLLAQVDKA
ncbi:MAG TPA: non-ribosomal peptide synthetase [Ktedonobacteraceae bacterium]|nr:non-ribosomal peptide synthetase [Ktedonobacteraceae bacterium]